MQREASPSRCKAYPKKESQMKHKILKYGLVAAFFIGIALMLYPPVSDYINSRNMSKVVLRRRIIISGLRKPRRAFIIRSAFPAMKIRWISPEPASWAI